MQLEDPNCQPDELPTVHHTLDGFEIRSHHVETMGNYALLVLSGQSSFQGFLNGARSGFVHLSSYIPFPD